MFAKSTIDINGPPMVVNHQIYLVIIFQDTRFDREFTYLNMYYVIIVIILAFYIHTKNCINSSNVGIKPGLAFFLNLSAIVSWTFLNDGLDVGFFI